MNRILPLLGLSILLSSTSCQVQSPTTKTTTPLTYHNPILPGDWSDPGVIRVGDDYYSCRSSFGWQPGIPIAHSKDLLHWQYIGHAFASHPRLLPGDTRYGIWGLEMNYNPHTKQFQIYAPTEDGEVFVYSSTKPEGPYTETSLDKNLGIDPGVFTDADGKIYFLTAKAVLYQLTPDGLAIDHEVTAINRKKYRFFEGPDLFHHGHYYYLLFSDGGTLPHQPSTISTLRATSLTRPWQEDPAGPTMFSTDNGAKFEAPAHGTLLETQTGEWFLTYHAHEPAFYSLGREMCMEPVTWTADGWWRPQQGKVPSTTATAPNLPQVPYALAQSDDFSKPTLGLQWFFTTAPDFSGKTWSLTENPGHLRIHPAPGNIGSLTALPALFQQRVIDKQFSFQTTLTFDAKSGHEAAGLHMYHDPLMNLWIASTVNQGEKRLELGKTNLGQRTILASIPNTLGNTLHLKIAVNEETATAFYSADAQSWTQLGNPIYFGASAHHLKHNTRGNPDLGWVGRYKDKSASPEQLNGTPSRQQQPKRGGNLWTATTFGLFAVADGADKPASADFSDFRVTKP